MDSGKKTAHKAFRWLAVAFAVFSALLSPLTGSMFYINAKAAAVNSWLEMSGTCSQDGGSQYNSGKLQLLPIDDSILLFEIDVMKGSEAADSTSDFRLPGTLYINDNGVGIWEDETEDGMVSLTFVLDGSSVEITQTGELPLSVEGRYTWLEASLEMTAEAAGALVENLPTAATSLNSNNGAYRLEAADIVLDDWFYNIKAVFTDTESILSEFLVAADMSAVYRIDTDEPILIYGSAASMMTAARTLWLEPGEGNVTEAAGSADSDTGEGAEGTELSVPFVSARVESSLLAVGKNTDIHVTVPGGIPAAVSARSSDPAVATVSEDGVISGIAPGTAAITGAITIDGEEKPFQFDIHIWAPGIEAVDVQTRVPVGSSFTMQARVNGSEAPLQWHSSDPDIATIDLDTGFLTAKRDGQITLTAAAGELKKEWIIDIGDADAASLDGSSLNENEASKPAVNAILWIALGLGAAVVVAAILILVRKKTKNVV
jgi:hypothetical protein